MISPFNTHSRFSKLGNLPLRSEFLKVIILANIASIFFLFPLPLIWAKLSATFEVTHYLTDEIYATNHSYLVSEGKRLPRVSLLCSILIFVHFRESRPPSSYLHYKVPLSTSNDGLSVVRGAGNKTVLKETPYSLRIYHRSLRSISKMILFHC